MRRASKPKPTLTEQQAWGFNALMVTAAFRYCLGRQTYIVGACADWLIENWGRFPEWTRFVIWRDLEKAFERDDEARVHGETHKPLGWDCDRRDWERVRALWANETAPAGRVEADGAET